MSLVFFQKILWNKFYGTDCNITFFITMKSIFGKSLMSILNQSYKNWFLILINDASTDNSLKIVNEVLKSKKISKKKYKLILNKKILVLQKV